MTRKLTNSGYTDMIAIDGGQPTEDVLASMQALTAAPPYTVAGSSTTGQAYGAGPVDPPSPGTTTPDVYAWRATAGGAWGVPSNWIDVTTAMNPALVAPGVNNIVTIVGGPSATQVITSAGNSASLATTGQVILTGTVATGDLSVGNDGTYSTLTSAQSLTASSATIVSGVLQTLSGGTITITGAAILRGMAHQDLYAADGGTILVGSLILGKTIDDVDLTSVSVDAKSKIVVGAALGGAVAGSLTINAGATASGTGTIHANITVLGSLLVQDGGELAVYGAVNTTGLTQIGGGAILEASTATGSVSFAGTGGELVLHPTVPSKNSAPGSIARLQLAVSGFTTGDKIDFIDPSVTRSSYQATTSTSGTLTLYDGATSGRRYLIQWQPPDPSRGRARREWGHRHNQHWRRLHYRHRRAERLQRGWQIRPPAPER